MYEQIAQEYQRLVRDPNSPLCRAEAYTFQQQIGPLDGLRVLDLGCGEGFYTRQLQQRGAAAVVGVDQSPSMIALAREAEAKQPSGIQYHLADVCTLEPLGQFDLVVSFFMLNHARSYTELAAMCRGIAAHLKEGGRFFGFNHNLELPPAAYPLLQQYGRTHSAPDPLREGDPITVSYGDAADCDAADCDAADCDAADCDAAECSFVDYYLSRATYRAAFQAAGLEALQWRPPDVDPADLAREGETFWQTFLAYPSFVTLEASRQHAQIP
ncbi:MAG: class I SAM-dependent methyltransferase [Chloroflexi bacterium]|nr:class I SAM-dependent methyltransferase [Chloroflexota bacterium]